MPTHKHFLDTLTPLTHDDVTDRSVEIPLEKLEQAEIAAHPFLPTQEWINQTDQSAQEIWELMGTYPT